MSILAGLGGVPSSLTVPLTVAAVAGSIGVEAAGGFDSEVGEDDCSSPVFLLQPAKSSSPTRASKPSIANHVFFMIAAPFLKSQISQRMYIFYTEQPFDADGSTPEGVSRLT